MLTIRKSLLFGVITVFAVAFVVGCGEYTFPTVAVTGVSINQGNQSIGKDDTVQLTATVTPVASTDRSVSWTSGNTAIATVSGTGLVTGLTPGGTTITVKTTDGGKTDTIEVSVHEGAAGP